MLLSSDESAYKYLLNIHKFKLHPQTTKKSLFKKGIEKLKVCPCFHSPLNDDRKK